MKLDYIIGKKIFTVSMTKPPQEYTVSLLIDYDCQKTYSYNHIDDVENTFNVMCATLSMVMASNDSMRELDITPGRLEEDRLKHDDDYGSFHGYNAGKPYCALCNNNPKGMNNPCFNCCRQSSTK